jgi:hypothetical protein
MTQPPRFDEPKPVDADATTLLAQDYLRVIQP